MRFDGFSTMLPLLLALTVVKMLVSACCRPWKYDVQTGRLLFHNDEWPSVLIPDHLSIAHIKLHSHDKRRDVQRSLQENGGGGVWWGRDGRVEVYCDRAPN